MVSTQGCRILQKPWLGTLETKFKSVHGAHTMLNGNAPDTIVDTTN